MIRMNRTNLENRHYASLYFVSRISAAILEIRGLKRIEMLIKILLQQFSAKVVPTSFLDRSDRTTTQFSSTLTINPVSPSYAPPMTFTWSPSLKNLHNSLTENSRASLRSSCLGIMVAFPFSILMILPSKFFKSPSTTWTLSPTARFCFTSPLDETAEKKTVYLMI